MLYKAIYCIRHTMESLKRLYRLYDRMSVSDVACMGLTWCNRSVRIIWNRSKQNMNELWNRVKIGVKFWDFLKWNFQAKICTLGGFKMTCNNFWNLNQIWIKFPRKIFLKSWAENDRVGGLKKTCNRILRKKINRFVFDLS